MTDHDHFGTWMRLQEQALHMHKTAVDAAFKAMGNTAHFDRAAKAAQDIADAQVKAWESWLALWGVNK